MKPLSETTFVVTDIETTGLSPERHRVTEVACVYVQGGKIAGEERTLVNPEQFIPLAIQQLTGITNAMVLEAPKGEEIFPEVRRWLARGDAFVAHNVSFDFNFLQQSFRRHELDRLMHPRLCTLRLSRRLVPGLPGYSLDRLVGHFGIRVKNRHSALGDARATAEALIRLLTLLENDFNCTSLADIDSFQYRTIRGLREKPPNVQALEPILKELPTGPGIYRMLNGRREVLYVGKAKNLRERVASYFQSGASHEGKIAEMVKRVRKVEVEETGSELGALLLESRLIKELQPKYNTMGKRYRRYAFLRLDTADPFPRATVALQVEADGSEYFGPFKNRYAVESIVDTIDRVFKLRECPDPLDPAPDTVPCMYHSIRRCEAPCAELQTSEEYLREVDRVREFLTGSEEGIIGLLERMMMEHAEKLEFEEAALLRNRIRELRRVFIWRRRFAESLNNNNVALVLPAHIEGKQEVFLIRYGRLADQFLVGRRAPKATLARAVRKIYFDGSTSPPRLGREEIDEIRIIAGYIRTRHDEGRFVYVRPEDTPEEVVEAIVRNF